MACSQEHQAEGGGTKRKYPVTARMVRRVRYFLFSQDDDAVAARVRADVAPKDAVSLWAGILTAWYFLLRGGEWLAHDGRGYDPAKTILGSGIKGYGAGAEQVHSLSEAEQVALEVRASKVDQHNIGTWRNHFKTGDEMCPVEALAALQRQHPERFGTGSECLRPLFRRHSGAPILASQVKSLLEAAAVAEGLPVDRFGSHSLRIGGASALLHAKVPIEIIKRWGRWVSDSFQRYLWESVEDSRDLSKLMAQDTTPLAITRQGPGGGEGGSTTRLRMRG